MDRLISMLRAAGDATRLRLLLLLLDAELTVTELKDIVGQSQPRVSRHLKLLCDAGLLERFKEGSWVFYRAADRGDAATLAQTIAALADSEANAALARDRQKLAAARSARADAAAEYFKKNAPRWERIRSLQVPEPEVESAVLRLLGDEHPARVLDAGTGTGRILELLAPHIREGLGIDSSAAMLAIARENLAKAGVKNCQLRLGDVYKLPAANASFDAVVFHQVLHYLDDPLAALREAQRVLKPGGRLLIADFAPHELEFLRAEHAHRRLGFSDREVQGWFKTLGMKPVAAESLAPQSDAKEGGGKLTVMVWLATAPVARKREAA